MKKQNLNKRLLVKLAAVAAICLVAPQPCPAQQDIRWAEELPDNITLADFLRLQRRKDALDAERLRLEKERTEFNSDCARVKASDIGKVAECRDRHARVTSAIEQYKAALSSYKEDIYMAVTTALVELDPAYAPLATSDPSRVPGRKQTTAPAATTILLRQFREAMERAILLMANAKSKKAVRPYEDDLLDIWMSEIDRMEAEARQRRPKTTLDELARQLEVAHQRIRREELAAFRALKQKAAEDLAVKMKAADELKAQGRYSEVAAEDAKARAAKDIAQQLEKALLAADARAQQELQKEFRRIMAQP